MSAARARSSKTIENTDDIVRGQEVAEFASKPIEIKEGAADPTKHLDLVHRVARRLKRKVPGHVAYEDLVGAGMIGLIEAAKRFDPSRGLKFPTFAELRIHGAMLDELRRYDPMGHHARAKQKKIATAVRDLHAKLERQPEDREVAEALAIPLETYRQMSIRYAHVSEVSLEAANDGTRPEIGANEPSIEDKAIVGQRHQRVREAINGLSPRRQQIVDMYYGKDLTLKEIGAELGVTESRVCQILGESTRKLREQLGAKLAA